MTADVNGDGKTDILQVTNGKIYVYTLNSSNYLQLLWTTTDSRIKTTLPIMLGDYNGDGKIDFITPTAANSSLFAVFISTGAGFVKNEISYSFQYKQTQFNSTGSTLYGYNLIPVDINGDGRTDIIDYQTTTYTSNSNGYQNIKIYNNSASSSTGLTLAFTLGGNISKTGDLSLYPIPIFLTSDKPNLNLDFGTMSDKWISAFSFQLDNREDMLLRSVLNNGINYTIQYNNLNSHESGLDYTTVYQPNYTQTYPNIDIEIAPGTKVVTSLQRKYGSIPMLKQIFSYYGAVSNIEGLGFLGFQGVARSNWHTSTSDRIFNIAKFDTQLRGAPIENYSTPSSINFNTIPSDYINETENTYASPILGANKSFLLKLNSQVSSSSLEGTTTTINYLYDSYNNPSQIKTYYSGDGTKTIDLTYLNSTGTVYYIGRPATKIETSVINSNTFSSEQQFTYSNSLLTQLKIKGNATQFNTETYVYDSFGNILKKTLTPYGMTGRETNFEYDISGRFLTKSTDVEGLSTLYTYNTATATIASEKNPYNQTTNYYYDPWNRLIKSTNYLGKNILTAYQELAYQYTITTTGDDGSSKIETYDPLKRLILSKEKDALGNWVQKNYEYDKFDRIYRESEPFIGTAASQWNVTDYDFYGRPKKLTTFTGKITNITYSYLSTTVNDGTKSVTTTKNAFGNVISVQDPGGIINYSYYGNGTMKSADYSGVVISVEQDGWGRKTKLTDPSAGIYTYEYNGFGEITKETSPKGSTDYTYSTLGVLQQKKIYGDLTDMTLNYSYDATSKLVTSIALVNTDGNNSNYSYTYDANKRPITTIETNPYASFTKRYTYDAFGRVDTEENEAKSLSNSKISTKKTKNTYQNGEIISISDFGTNEVLWTLNTLNARGQVILSTVGNNLKKTNTYNSYGYLTEIKSDKVSGSTITQIIKLGFNFDTQRGILNSRTNSMFNWTESFMYDASDRLTNFTDNNSAKTQSYDSRGRITNNSAVGAYVYNTNSYQQTELTLNTLGETFYTPYQKQQISYNAFKSPVEITEEGKDKVSFQYNAVMGRASMFYGGLQTDKTQRRYRRHYSADGSMEFTYDSQTGKTTFVTYIMGDAYSSPVIWHSEQGSSTVNNFYYLHRDYLGSILTITDKDGVVKEKRHFDAWGNIVKLQDGNGNNLTSFTILDRGYTGHEHLLGVGLINMNARLYDPILHRFLAPDNFVQDPFNTQNFNRYGYVLNNPLMYFDTSGELTFKGFVKLVYGVVAIVVGAALAVGVAFLTVVVVLPISIFLAIPTLIVSSYLAISAATYLDHTINEWINTLPDTETHNSYSFFVEDPSSHINKQGDVPTIIINKTFTDLFEKKDLETFSLRGANYKFKD